MTKEQILDTYESFKYTEDGCDELHYYRENVLMAMEEYHLYRLKLLGVVDVVKYVCDCEKPIIRMTDKGDYCLRCRNKL